jgi:hypothetical protein
MSRLKEAEKDGSRVLCGRIVFVLVVVAVRVRGRRGCRGRWREEGKEVERVRAPEPS